MDDIYTVYVKRNIVVNLDLIKIARLKLFSLITF